MKKIIHNKFDISKLDLDTAYKIHLSLSNDFGEDYLVVSTPTDLNMIEGDDIILRINAEEYSYDKLVEIIEKAKDYDGLCK